MWGLHPARAVLATRSRAVLRAHVLAGDELGRAAADAPLVRLQERLRARGVHVIRADRNSLARLARGATHQGVVLEVEPAAPAELEPGAPPSRFAPTPAAGGAHPLLVVLDELVDAHNTGAVLRSALLLGADAVAVSRGAGSALLGAAASKASSGAMEAWLASRRLFTFRNTASLVQACGDAGWRTVGTTAPPSSPAASEQGEDMQGPAPAHAAPRRAVPASSLRRDAPTLLVLGNEAHGLRPVVRKACHTLCFVEQAPAAGPLAWPRRGARDLDAEDESVRGRAPLFVDSLNVAASAAILLQLLRPIEGGR